MVRAIGSRAVERFGDRYGYDVQYMRDMLDSAPALFVGLGRISSVARKPRYTSTSAFFAAKIVGALSEDCGPCVQLVVDMAREAGMDDGEIRAVVSGEIQGLPEDTRLGAELALEICRASDRLTRARQAVQVRWGPAGVAELSLTVALARLYPTLKRGMGYAQRCEQVHVGDEREPTVDLVTAMGQKALG